MLINKFLSIIENHILIYPYFCLFILLYTYSYDCLKSEKREFGFKLLGNFIESLIYAERRFNLSLHFFHL